MGISRDLTARNLAGLADGSVEQVRVRMLPDGRMTREDAAQYLGRQAKTLAMWALRGKGPLNKSRRQGLLLPAGPRRLH